MDAKDAKAKGVAAEDTTAEDKADTKDASKFDSSNPPCVPKKIQRAVKKLVAEGEEPILIFPAILERYTSNHIRSKVRMGMDRIFGYLVATKVNVHFIRPGIMWDQVRTVPLDKLEDIEYLDEFHYNTLKLKTSIGAENVIFYDDVDGMKFYQYIRQWLKESVESKNSKESGESRESN